MRRRPFCFASLKIAAGIFLIVVGGLSTNRADDDGVAEFINSHPDFRGYVTPMPPRLAMRANHEMTLQIIYSAEGPVTKVEIVRSSGVAALDSSTVNYVKGHWRSTFGKPSAKIQEFVFKATR